MNLLNFITVVLFLAAHGLSFPTSNSYPSHDFSKFSVLEKLQGPPADWKLDGGFIVDKDKTIVSLRIHLVQQGMASFHEMAMKVNAEFRTSEY